MNSTITRLAAGAAVAATVLGGALTVGAGVSSAVTTRDYDLYCYAGQNDTNEFRINYYGVLKDTYGGPTYNGTGVFQRWNGQEYVAVTNQNVISVNGVVANGTDANAACRAISGAAGNGFIFGNFG